VVKGHAEEIARGHDLFDTVGLPLFPRQAAPKQRFVRIVPEEISGRQFHVVDRGSVENTLDGRAHVGNRVTERAVLLSRSDLRRLSVTHRASAWIHRPM
jgi:hypothetical protein